MVRVVHEANISSRVIEVSNDVRVNVGQHVGFSDRRLRRATQGCRDRQYERKNPNAQFVEHLIPLKIGPPTLTLQ